MAAASEALRALSQTISDPPWCGQHLSLATDSIKQVISRCSMILSPLPGQTFKRHRHQEMNKPATTVCYKNFLKHQ